MTDEDRYVRADSDNLPKLDAIMLVEYASRRAEYIAAEIRNIKSNRDVRESYVNAAVGRVSLRRIGSLCKLKAEVCPEYNVRSPNYTVSMMVNEDEETIEEVQCHSCAASQGGCKHGLAFLMWVFNESNKPPPAEVESYWRKPILSGIAANRNICVEDFGQINLAEGDVDVQAFVAMATSSEAPLSSLQRYHCSVDAISLLDLHQLVLKYVTGNSKSTIGPYSAHSFKDYCRLVMAEDVCDSAMVATEGQSDSRLWQFLRYGRICASLIHEAAHSTKLGGGLLKEKILGSSHPFSPKSMERRRVLKNSVIKVVERQTGLTLKKVGIQLCREYPEFEASPDGLTNEYVIEIKCPESDKSLKNYIVDSNRVAPKFMAQIQLQMKLCKKSKGLFCVADPNFEKTNNAFVLFVDYDPTFIDYVMTKASDYWEKNIFPVLLFSALA